MARQERNLNFTYLTIRWLLILVICNALSLQAQETSAQEAPQFLGSSLTNRYRSPMNERNLAR